MPKQGAETPAKKRPRRATRPPETRRSRALATRRRMLSAAYRRFCDAGWAGATVEAIARDAGVATQTVYFTFHTKAALLGEVIGAALTGFDRWEPMPAGPPSLLDLDAMRRLQPWMERFAAEPDARRAFALYLRGAAGMMDRVAPLVAVMREASLADAEARQLAELGEVRRFDAYRTLMSMIAGKQGGLRRGLSTRRAADVFASFYSGEVYQQLRARGWAPRAIHAFFVEALTELLLAPRPPSARA